MMKKVLIADDEQHICRLIENLIDWEKYNMEVAGFANDGNRAFKMCEELCPDFLITDIRMPGLNGIDLIKAMHDAFPHIQVIIITGYSEFPYAIQALKYRVVDYLLKPIEEEELIAALQKGLNLIEKEENYQAEGNITLLKSMQDIKDNLLTSILHEGQEAEKNPKRKQQLEESLLQFEGEAWQLLQIELILSSEDYTSFVQKFLIDKIREIVINEMRGEGIETIVGLENNNIFCLLNGDIPVLEQTYTVIKQIKNKLLMINDILQKISFTIGISNVYSDFNQVYDCVRQCQICVNHKILMGKNKIILFSDVPEVEFDAAYFVNENYRSVFLKAIADGNWDELFHKIDELSALLYHYTGKIDGTVVMETYHIMVELFLKGIQAYNLKDSLEFSKENLIEQKQCFYSISSMFNYLNDNFHMILRKCQMKKEEQNTRPIRNAQIYIEENAINPITLEDIAKHVGLSETYLSGEFKKQVGKSVVDYLTYTRIQHAKELLLNHEVSINEVAEQVGFNDAKYFTKRFKKFTGVSPNEYRKLFS
ncbi:MAG: response regulator [Lachnospiraceae bacterium]|nr:response regulator [Lachnospiraceae bacterium]